VTSDGISATKHNKSSTPSAHTEPEDIVTIDGDYLAPQVAASYLIKAQKNAIFIDNTTNHSVPAMLEALKKSGYTPADVSHIIITHVHLDHAGGTGMLASHCPNAKVVAHPRAAPHVIDPTRLVASARNVYGIERFAHLYGEIIPVAADRVYVPEDESIIALADRELKFIYTRGHANHHFVILDNKTKSIFKGDSFGLAYPMLQHGNRPFLFPSTSPTDFDAAEARISYDKIATSGAMRAYPTHFGCWGDLKSGHEMLVDYMDKFESIYLALVNGPNPEEELYPVARQALDRFFEHELNSRNVKLTGAETEILGMGVDLNAQGLVFAATRARKKMGAKDLK
jgi:glyoxylase-like metal-dependent hydrolase (beta-lactamase superfamily II)